MKKIININLSGRVIPIEDSAYEKLQSYIESLRRYFSKEEDRDEIINDIESRIAELMNEKLRKGATHITDDDINEIAASMGRPEDFDADAAEPKAATGSSTKSSTEQTSAEKKTRRRLYRDTNDKFIAGVCSGIANYLNIDPSIVRILFAIITFGGFGLGFVVYVVLWIVLPGSDEEGYIGKRLYRNPEDRIIGGVAGGLAAYFNRGTGMIRLIFLAPFLFSVFLTILRGFTWHYDFDFVPNIVFGSLGSTFILTYIILWIVLPEARSTYEKMEMRGEKVDVNTIRQNMKDRVKDWSEEVKQSAENIGNKAKEFANTKGKTFASEVGERARRGGSGLGHAIGVLFKVFFFFIAGTIAFGIFAALMALLFGGVVWWPINNFLWTSKWQQMYAWGTVIFFLAVPLIGFIIWIVRRIIRVRSRSSYLGWTFGFLWCIGWVSVILLAASLTKDFREYEYAPAETISIAQPSNGNMIVVVSEPELEYTGNFGWIEDDANGWDMSSDTMKLSLVNFDISKSYDSLYHVTIQKYSFGRNADEAMQRAQHFTYAVSSRDSLLDLASGFSISKNDKFRGQKVQINIQVPAGKKIRFDNSVRDKLNPVKIGHRGRRRGNVEVIFNDDYFWWRSNTDYVMQPNGELTDITGRKISGDDSYRYEQEWHDSVDIDRQLKDKEREIEELRKRKEEIRTPERRDTTGVYKYKPAAKGDAKNEEGIIANAKVYSPVLSLNETFF